MMRIAKNVCSLLFCDNHCENTVCPFVANIEALQICGTNVLSNEFLTVTLSLNAELGFERYL